MFSALLQAALRDGPHEQRLRPATGVLEAYSEVHSASARGQAVPADGRRNAFAVRPQSIHIFKLIFFKYLYSLLFLFIYYIKYLIPNLF